MKKIKYLLTAFFVTAAMYLFAVKATPEIIPVKQPDGTVLLVRLRGDENGHYMTTSDDYLVVRDTDGYLKYATVGDSGKMNVSNVIARNKNDRKADELMFVSKLSSVRKFAGELLKNRSFKRIPGKMAPVAFNPHRFSSPKEEKKESKFLVILVNFKDSKFKYRTTDFDTWLNEPGYNKNGGTGSVKDYYVENSMGQFIPGFDVFGPVELANNVAYYGHNSDGSGTDAAPEEMVAEACRKVKSLHPEVNFAEYDNDKDGTMDNVNVIFAGYSEASTGIENLIWPHRYYINDELVIDGVKVSGYACSAEFVGSSGDQMDGIGTFTHEFGHVLGLKDLYDTDDYSNGLALDPGGYSLMASGSYNNNSRTPPYLMTFERVMLGWSSPKRLNRALDMALKPVSENESYYISAQPDRDPSTGFEMFVLENRQKTGWDTYIPSHGLLIYHWDFTEEAYYDYWAKNGPNNDVKHRCMYIKCADGVDTENTRNGDTYPGRSGNTEFTDTSFPNACGWSGEKTNTPVTNIREENGIVYFQVNGGITPVSQIKTGKPSLITQHSAKITAEVVSKKEAVKEMGFCWIANEEPVLGKGSKQSVAVNDRIECNLSGLEPGTSYYVRSYMKMESGKIHYGAAIPFTTECSVKTAPYVDGFTSWTEGVPDCWEITDVNKDGSTWVYDKYTESIVYSFNYWNDANDWLISPKIQVPENGLLAFSRAITEVQCVEKLEIWVSVKSKEMKDFRLVKKFSFADYFGLMHFEEVDLKQYAGQEIYMAFVCRSEKLNNALWLKDVYVTSKLPVPLLKTFEPCPEGMLASWETVKGAVKYYLTVEEEKDSVVNVAKFADEKDYAVLKNADPSSGTLFFSESGEAETIDFPGGVTNVMFYYSGSGPFGESSVTIYGTQDGEKWEQIGPGLRLSASLEENECSLATYMGKKLYRKIRFVCAHNGRNVKISYLTFQYNENKFRETLISGEVGDVTSIKVKGDYQPGRTYVAYLNASDGMLFYDDSNEIKYVYPSSVGSNEGACELSVRSDNQSVLVNNVNIGSQIDFSDLSGRIFRSCIAGDVSCSFDLKGHQGLIFVRITCPDQNSVFKLWIK